MRNKPEIQVLVMLCAFLFTTSCKVLKPTGHTSFFPKTGVLDSAFIGVSIIDEASGDYLVQINADKHFTPASNTKLLTTYATLKHFGDSLPGWSYYESKDTLYIIPQADPTFLHPEFTSQLFFDYLKRSEKPIVLLLERAPSFGRFGKSWSWDGWLSTSNPERSQMPMYENVIRIVRKNEVDIIIPPYFTWTNEVTGEGNISLDRSEFSNTFVGKSNRTERLKRPYFTQENDSLLFSLLRDTLVGANTDKILVLSYTTRDLPFKIFYTQKTDQVVQLMMHQSDNFIAEQLLLMVSKNTLGKFDEQAIKDSLIKNDFKEAIKTGRWADGSGLSRNNLFTPNEFVSLLKAMQIEFGKDRLSYILPHGNQGTLSGLYKGYEDNIFAKTGTLTDHLALSGYLTTLKGKKLIFSIIVNNHRGKAKDYRKAIESRLINIIENN